MVLFYVVLWCWIFSNIERHLRNTLRYICRYKLLQIFYEMKTLQQMKTRGLFVNYISTLLDLLGPIPPMSAGCQLPVQAKDCSPKKSWPNRALHCFLASSVNMTYFVIFKLYFFCTSWALAFTTRHKILIFSTTQYIYIESQVTKAGAYS